MERCRRKVFLSFITLILFSLISLLFSCKNQLLHGKNEPKNTDEETLYEVSGKILFDYTGDFSQVGESASRFAIAIPSTIDCTVTAKEAEVTGSSPAVWSEKSGGKSFTGTVNAEAKTFTIKLPAGNWLISAACDFVGTPGTSVAQVSTPADGVAKITIDPAGSSNEDKQAYKANIVITVKSTITIGNGTVENGHGTVNLTLNDQTGTIKTVKATEISSGTLTTLQTMSETTTGSKTFQFTWGTPTGTPPDTVNPQVTSGAHKVMFDFYTEEAANITGSSLPVYSYTDYINVFDGLETNIWLLSEDSEVYGSTSSGSAVFKITQSALDNFKKYTYYVNTPATLKSAVTKIIAMNNADTTDADSRPEFKLVLTDNITYSSGDAAELAYDGITPVEDINADTTREISKFAIPLTSTELLKITICGKDKLYTLNLASTGASPVATNPCGIFANPNTRLTLSNIEVKGAEIGIWRYCDYDEDTYIYTTNCFITLKDRVVINDNTQNLRLEATNPTGGQTGYPAAPLIIDSTFSAQSRIGLTVYYTGPDIDGNEYGDGNITTGFTTRFGTASDSVQQQIFFSDDNYTVYLDEDEITWSDAGAEGQIDFKIADDVYFTAKGNTQNDNTVYNGAKYDTVNKRYLIGYKDTSAYISIVPKIKIDDVEILLWNNTVYSGFDEASFTIKLLRADGTEVPRSSAGSPNWKIEPYIPGSGGSTGQTGVKFSIVGNSDEVIPVGRYKLFVSGEYDGKKCTAEWDLSYIKVSFSLSKNRIKTDMNKNTNEFSESVYIYLNVTVDDGDVKDVSSIYRQESSSNKYYTGTVIDEDSVIFKKVTGIENNDFTYVDGTSGSCTIIDEPNNSYPRNRYARVSMYGGQESEPGFFYLSADVNYNGIKCYNSYITSGTALEGYEETTKVQALVSLDDIDAYYYTPGVSVKTELNSDNLQELINRAQDSGKSDCVIYLLGNAVATDATMTETKYKLSSSDANETDNGYSFVNINAYSDAKPINIKITSYNVASSTNTFSINAAGTAQAAGSNVVSAGKKGRVVYAGKNANVTLENVQIKGGYANKGAAILSEAGSKIILKNAFIGEKTESEISDSNFTGDNADVYDNFAPTTQTDKGSFIYIKSDSTNPSAFISEDSEFCRNRGTLYISANTVFSMSGTVSDSGADGISTTSKFWNNFADSSLINIQQCLSADSCMDGIFFYKNKGGTDSSIIDIDGASSSPNLFEIKNVRIYDNKSFNSGIRSNKNQWNSYSAVRLADCNFYKNNPVSGSSYTNFNGISILGYNTLYLENCTFTELSDSTCKAINMPGTIETQDLNMAIRKLFISGQFYTDGIISLLYIPYHYISSHSVYIGNYVEVNSLELPAASELNAISGLTYSAPAEYATLVLHTDGTNTPSNENAGYIPYSQVLDGNIVDVRTCYNKFTVKLDDTNGTQKQLNERGQLVW